MAASASASRVTIRTRPPAGVSSVLIRNAILESRHLHRAGHLLGVRQGGLSEVSRLEQGGDLRQMPSDRLKVRLVARLLHGHLDGSAVRIEQEMMNRAFLIEAHRLGPAREHVAVMGVVIVRVRVLWLLRPSSRRHPRGS